MVCLILLVGALLRLWDLSHHSFWYDEGITLHVATSDDITRTLRSDRHPPLAFYFFRWWVQAFGDQDWTLRLLPASLSCVSLALFAYVCMTLISGGSRYGAMLAYAVSPYNLWIAQEVRMYAFLEFAVLLVIAAALYLLSGKGRRILGHAGLVLGGFLALGCHYMGGMLLFGLVPFLWFHYRRERQDLRTHVLAGALVVLGMAPWLWWIWDVMPGQMQTDWDYQSRHSFRDLIELPMRQMATDFDAIPVVWQWLGYVFGAVVLFAVAACLVAAFTSKGREGAYILSLAFGPTLGALMFTAFLPANITSRYLFTGVAGVYLCVAEGLGGLRYAAIRRLLWFVVIAFLLLLTALHKLENRREDYRSACAEVLQHWQDGDTVVAVSGTPEGHSQSPVRYYLREQPEMVRSIRDLADVCNDLAAGVGPKVIHVVYRDAPYAWEPLKELVRHCRVEVRGPRRFRIEYLKLSSKRP